MFWAPDKLATLTLVRGPIIVLFLGLWDWLFARFVAAPSAPLLPSLMSAGFSEDSYSIFGFFRIVCLSCKVSYESRDGVA